MREWILKNIFNFRTLKRLFFIAALLPVALSVYQGFAWELGARPIEKILHRSGDWTLNFLLITLSLSPLSRLPGLQRLRGLRRMAGLYAFFYATLHLLIYLGLDQLLDFRAIFKDITRHKRIYVGILTYLMLIPLAVTSTNAWIRRLGFPAWKRLHLLVFPAILGGALHYLLLVRRDLTWPLIYMGAALFLISLRVPGWMGKRKKGG